MRPAAVAALAAAALLTALATLHQVDEGHVGVYWRGGALLDSTSGPGWHVRLPFVTTFAQGERHERASERASARALNRPAQCR
jgi:regulator of protease activity HflC (stomatin/prohibitin superfamily)